MKRRRVLWSAGAAALLLLLAAGVAGVVMLRSQWFVRKVHSTLVAVVETATGGRAEVGAIQFDWRNLRARVAPFTLHGTEPAGKPPLFQAASIEIGLKIISLARRDVDLQELNVAAPRIYLIVGPDGRTNIPGPKNHRARRPVMETILDLAVSHLQIESGIFQIEGQAPRPFAARADNLQARFQYDRSGPRYRGDLAMDPLELNWPGLAAMPVRIQTAVLVEKNRIQVTAGHAWTADTAVDFTGALENLAAPAAKVQFEARLPAAEAGRLARVPQLRSGAVEVTGSAAWSQAAGASMEGRLHATGLNYRDASVALRDFRLDGGVRADARGIQASGLRLAGVCTATVAAKTATAPTARVAPSRSRLRLPARGGVKSGLPVEGQIGEVRLAGRDVELDGVALAVLGGSFQGTARLRDWREYHVAGRVAGFRVRPMVAMYSPEPLPWDALVSGAVELEGALGEPDRLRASGEWEIAPAPQSAPVRGQINARYVASTGVLDLGRSTLSLPASQVDFSGALDSQLHVHLETRDFEDLLPAAGRSAASLPVKLENGAAVFDGTITGKLDQPRVAGHLRVTNVAYQGRRLDALAGDLAAAADSLRVANGSAAFGALRAQFQGQMGLRQWKADDGSPLTGSGSLTAANLPDILTLTKVPVEQSAGTVTGTIQVNGTIGAPVLAGQVDVTKGAVRGEPFDRFSAQFHAAANRIEMTYGQLAAGDKQVRLTGAFDHPEGQFDQGKLHFQVVTNAMPLDEIRTLASSRPGLRGSVTVTATGEAAVAGSQVRLTDLGAEVHGRELQLTGQALGDATLTASSQGQMLHAHLESNFADSQVLGDGEWRLEDDDPGTATIRFSKLDFAQLRAWIAPLQPDAQTPAGQPLAGFAEGQVRIDGPLLQRTQWRAELRLASFEIRPADNPGTQGGVSFALRNSGPIVAQMANSVVTVQSAHLVGRSTDLAVTGRVALNQNNPLDLRLNGQVDLAIMHDLDRDFQSSGTVATDATVRGTFADPQIAGRVQFENAAFSLADFPNGVSNANGAIVFTRDRATIQSFSGDTGGGKVELAGFATYTGGIIVYRLRARVDHVRVRYPEGVSTVASANLSLTGARDHSMLAGTVTVLRTGFNPQGDFSSLITRSAEPVRTPAAQTGLLGGMSFSIQINTAPDIQFESALTEGLQVDANLTLRGSPSNPSLLGRITITQGHVVFYGTKFNINEGSISFFNPLRIDPVLDIDLETKERGIDVTLTVSGPLTHPNLTPHSDPPLQFSEIVALLATGEGPSSDPTLLAQQSTAPQSWQQMGASALLGQAISSPVTGRLQRFFGVSKLRIDPTLPGVENNPQARLTLDQQVTSAITFTYITNVTTSNPQVVRVEWALSKQWSVVALREENGVFGIDFYLKKRF
ncbi:MAG TPA: translocation/assembly module TamB domain-containing protein [Bryobacteraceae bacterium]|nr:translocation/assembly module TamB domain-containing protein [Bryobacteraceae bacterium]